MHMLGSCGNRRTQGFVLLNGGFDYLGKGVPVSERSCEIGSNFCISYSYGDVVYKDIDGSRARASETAISVDTPRHYLNCADSFSGTESLMRECGDREFGTTHGCLFCDWFSVR